jgi:hypothetical protein
MAMYNVDKISGLKSCNGKVAGMDFSLVAGNFDKAGPLQGY